MSSDVRLPSHGILGRAFPLTQLEPRAKLAHTIYEKDEMRGIITLTPGIAILLDLNLAFTFQA